MTRANSVAHRLAAALVCMACAILWQAWRPAAAQQPSLPPAPRIVWSIEGKGWGTPAADETAAFFLSADHQVIAVDSASGATRWRSPTGMAGGPPLGARLRIAGALVVAADRGLVAFDRADGATRWHFTPDDGGSVGPYLGAVDDDTLFCGSSSGRLLAVDAGTGGLKWSATPSGDGSATTIYEPMEDRGLVVAGFTRFAPVKSGGVIAVDAASNAVRWEIAFPTIDGEAQGWSGGLAVWHDVVIASSANGDIVGLSRADGGVVWTIEHSAAPLPLPYHDYRPVVVAGDLLIAGSLLGHVVAYDIQSRQPRWYVNGLARGSVAMGLALDGDAVYVPYVSGRLVALHAGTGQEQWTTDPNAARFLWPPTVRGDRLFAAGESALLAFGR